MVITCWSVKGGSGTTVVASALALVFAQHHRSTTLVDLAGDSAPSLGSSDVATAEPRLPTDIVDPRFLDQHASPVNEHLDLVVVRASGLTTTANRSTAHALHHLSCRRADEDADQRRVIVIDAGTLAPAWLRAASSHDLLVVRGCYLALRRAAYLNCPPSGVVLIDEPGRALGRLDTERVVGAPVLAAIPWDAAVARTVDAGLLAGRMPQQLRAPLEALPWLH